MAVEGGSAYRNRLVKREQNKKNLIDLRRRQSENPFEWVNQLQRGDFEQAYKSYEKEAAKNRLSPEAYGSFIDAAFQRGADMEGLISPALTNTNVNLQSGRALEGLKSVVPAAVPLSKAGFAADSRRQQGFGGALTGIMQQYGDQRFMLNKQEKAEQNVEMLKSILKYAKEDPSSFASSIPLSFIAPFANIAAEATGNNDVYDFIKRTKGMDGGADIKDNVIASVAGLGPYGPMSLISRGDVIASEGMFRDYSKPEDYVYAGVSLTPGQWARLAMLPVKAGRFGVGAAVRGAENVATKGVPIPIPFGVGGPGIMRVGGKGSRVAGRKTAQVPETQPQTRVVTPEEQNIAEWDDPLGAPRGTGEGRLNPEGRRGTPQFSRRQQGLGEAEKPIIIPTDPIERAQLARDLDTTVDQLDQTVALINKYTEDVYRQNRGMGDDPIIASVEDLASFETLKEVISKSPTRYGNPTDDEIRIAVSNINKDIQSNPGRVFRMTDLEDGRLLAYTAIHHGDRPFYLFGPGNPADWRGLPNRLNMYYGARGK